MKKYVFGFLAFLSVGAFANVQANEFQCKGNHVELSYSTTSLSGQPLFNLNGKNYFGRNAIHLQASQLGSLVTVTTLSAPDAFVTTQTLVMPGVNLRRGGDAVVFDTMLIQTTSRTSIAGPKLVNGALKSYQVTPVRCTAKQVIS